jgi:hypothetical protein
MILPGAQVAEITEDKVKGYLLNADHPDGATKARFFATMGFTADAWIVFAEALRRLATAIEVAKCIETAYGTKYIVDGPLETPSGRMPVVRTVWIVDRGREIARLVTAYPSDAGERQ